MDQILGGRSEVVEGLPVETLDDRTEGLSNSIGSLLYHVAAIELDWLYSEILEQPVPDGLLTRFPAEVRDEQGRPVFFGGVELSDHLERLAAVRRTLLEELKEMTDRDFYRARILEPYDVNPAWVLYHLLEHEAKHGAQMALLRRA